MEEWKPIEDFPGYEVSDQGRIRNARTEYVLSQYPNGRGRIQVVLYRDGRNNARAVHQLVAKAFLYPAPEGTIPMHLDGDVTNNAVSNLDYKPLLFVMARTRQMKRTVPKDSRRIRHVASGVVYDNSLECAKAIDGFEDLILLTVKHGPDRKYKGSTFEFVYDGST